MIRLPLGSEFVEVGALAYLFPRVDADNDSSDATPDDLEVAVDVWDLSGPIPEFGSLDWLYEAIQVTANLIKAIEDGGSTILGGKSAEDVYYFYCALIDGLSAVEAAFGNLEELEDAAENFDDLVDRLVVGGLFTLVRPEPPIPVNIIC